MSTNGKISRRAMLTVITLSSAGAAVPLLLASASAEAKASKAAVHYQDSPSGMRMCHMCKFFTSASGDRSGVKGGAMMGEGMMGAGACEVVEGKISPMGYCDLYAPRAT
jgi:hypothetical protein